MMTTTHLLVGAAIVTRKNMSRRMVGWAFLAALIPDVNMIAMLVWARMSNFSGNIWRQPDGLYWSEPWQTYSAIVNSAPLYATILGLGYLVWRSEEEKAKRIGQIMMVFGGAALAHVLLDFPVHTDDAHQHFWPLSTWRFHSFMSYYQQSAFAQYVSLVEMGMGLIAAIILWRRHTSKLVRGFVVLLVLPYLIRILPRDMVRGFFTALFSLRSG